MRRLTGRRTLAAPQSKPLAVPLLPVVLILGPYASKWFSQQDPGDNARYAGQAAWLLISEPQDLAKRLEHIRQHTPGVPVMAFFPLLPDGHETSELMVNSLINWQHHFSGEVDFPHLPCTIALYARLSNERRNNSRSNTTWLGSLDISQRKAKDFLKVLEDLQRAMMPNMPCSADQIQRAAMGQNLLGWLDENGVIQAMQQLFAHTPLQPNGMLLCDCGNGFTRHGAWANWLEEHYAILPALCSSLSFPPLPKLIAPPSRVLPPPALLAPLPRKRYWSSGLFLLLGAYMLGNTWLAGQQLRQFHQQMLPMDRVQELSVQRIQGYISDLKQYQKRFSDCGPTHLLLRWGLSPCSILAKQTERHIAQLQEIPTLTSAGPNAMFDSSSTKLQPGAQEMLQNMVALANAYPQHNLLIVGHSDNTGNDERNLFLSEQRARAVSDWLEQQGINPERLIIRAAGSAEPIATNDTPAGRQQNRRVEILALPLEKTNKELTH